MFKRGDIVETRFAGGDPDGIGIIVIDHTHNALINWIVQSNRSWYFDHSYPVKHDVILSASYVVKIGEAQL